MILGKLINFSNPKFPHLQNQENSCFHLRLLKELNELKYIVWYLAHSKIFIILLFIVLLVLIISMCLTSPTNSTKKKQTATMKNCDILSSSFSNSLQTQSIHHLVHSDSLSSRVFPPAFHFMYKSLINLPKAHPV